MLYVITKDCRIANKDFKKWDIVSKEEVWNYYTSVMKPCEWKPVKSKEPEKVVEKKTDNQEKGADENKSDEAKKADDKKAAKAKEWQSKKK